MKPLLQFNAAPADYTSPAYLARQAARKAARQDLLDASRVRAGRMLLKTHRPPVFLLALVLALLLTSCAAHRPAPAASALTASAPIASAPADSLRPTPPAAQAEPTATTATTATTAAAPNAPRAGFLSGLGNVFSTPQGRTQRQAVRLARAAVPHTIGKGAVYAVNSKVTNGGNKPTGPVIQADSGATVSNAAANAQQQTVKGDGNKLAAKQANPTQQAKGWAATLADNLTGWIPWVIVGALVLAVVFRKRLPIVGPFFS